MLGNYYAVIPADNEFYRDESNFCDDCDGQIDDNGYYVADEDMCHCDEEED